MGESFYTRSYSSLNRMVDIPGHVHDLRGTWHGTVGSLDKGAAVGIGSGGYRNPGDRSLSGDSSVRSASMPALFDEDVDPGMSACTA
jgi:hypothetical protein